MQEDNIYNLSFQHFERTEVGLSTFRIMVGQDLLFPPITATYWETRNMAFYLSFQHIDRPGIWLFTSLFSILTDQEQGFLPLFSAYSQTRNRAFYLSFQHIHRPGIGLSTSLFSVLTDQEQGFLVSTSHLSIFRKQEGG